jgi:DNA-binding NtrC family response regulator
LDACFFFSLCWRRGFFIGIGLVEIVLIESALKRAEGTVSKASELLKINRTTLIEKMKKLQINT